MREYTGGGGCGNQQSLSQELNRTQDEHKHKGCNEACHPMSGKRKRVLTKLGSKDNRNRTIVKVKKAKSN